MFWGERVLARLLFFLCLSIAVGLGLLIVFAPWMPLTPNDDFSNRAYQLFAEDSIVRKTALVSAVGLWVTAVVFFRVPRRIRFSGQRRND
jgi:hypothetical protein